MHQQARGAEQAFTRVSARWQRWHRQVASAAARDAATARRTFGTASRSTVHATPSLSTVRDSRTALAHVCRRYSVVRVDTFVHTCTRRQQGRRNAWEAGTVAGVSRRVGINH